MEDGFGVLLLVFYDVELGSSDYERRRRGVVVVAVVVAIGGPGGGIIFDWSCGNV